jgi:hypothetical protein
MGLNKFSQLKKSYFKHLNYNYLFIQVFLYINQINSLFHQYPKKYQIIFKLNHSSYFKLLFNID